MQSEKTKVTIAQLERSFKILPYCETVCHKDVVVILDDNAKVVPASQEQMFSKEIPRAFFTKLRTHRSTHEWILDQNKSKLTHECA